MCCTKSSQTGKPIEKPEAASNQHCRTYIRVLQMTTLSKSVWAPCSTTKRNTFRRDSQADRVVEGVSDDGESKGERIRSYMAQSRPTHVLDVPDISGHPFESNSRIFAAAAKSILRQRSHFRTASTQFFYVAERLAVLVTRCDSRRSIVGITMDEKNHTV